MRFVKTAESIWNIPSGFNRVEYLESTGTQYIDTGYSANTNSLIEYHFNLTELPNSSAFFGSGSSTTSNDRFQGYYERSLSFSTKLASTTTYSDVQLTVGTKHYSKMGVPLAGYYIDDTFVSSAVGTPTNYNLYIFARNIANSANQPIKMKLYDFRISENNTLIRDMIPCIDPLGRPCLYDLVGKKTYYNQGTGEFTVGRQIIPVEYLEIPWNSQGNRIETNLTALENDRIIFDSEIIRTEATGDCYIARATNTYFNVGSRQNTFYIRFGSSSGSVGTPSVFGRHIYELYKEHFDIDGETKATPTFNAISGDWIIGNTASTQNVRHYSIKIKNTSTNETRADFVPCKDENNVGFMFDTVSGTVYENAGTGAFIVGQNKYKMKLRLIRDNILPTGYTQLEYIEAENTGMSGIQYAVGNYRLTDTTDWEITFSASHSGNNWIMGQPTWIGVHHRKDATTGNLPRVGITNSASTANQCYVDYTEDEKITLALKGTDVYANGVKVGSITRVSAGATQTKYGIFAYKDINQALPNLRISSARIYRLKIWDDGVLVQDLIPAMKNGVAGFYERVTKTFIEKESNSTSDFTTGKPMLPMVRFIKDILPAGYKAVNYLESSGSQYIDTGFKPNPATTKIDCAFCGFSGGSTQMFGTRTIASSNNENNTNICFGPVSGKIYIRGDWIRQNNNLVTDIEPEEYIHLIAHNQTVSINGTEYSSTLEKNNTYLDYNFCLFACNTAGTVQFYSKIRQYYFKIYDNNTLIRSFIPVIRLLDNKAGMWDTVTKQFYTTPTGNFITG